MILSTNLGLIDNEGEKITILSKVVVGLNEETGGAWSSDYAYIRSLPAEERNKYSIELIVERLKNSENLPSFFYNKHYTTWFTSDSFITTWFRNAQDIEIVKGDLSESELKKYNKEFTWITGIAYVDKCFVHFIYLMAIIGVWRNKKAVPVNGYGILTFIPLGWFCVILLSEMQTRYRYPAMPAFIALAALGIYEVYKLCKTHKWKFRRN